MSDDQDEPNKTPADSIRGPGGLTMRQVFDQVQKSRARDRESAKMRNALAQKHGRWQRFMHYVWDKKKG